MKSLEEIHRAEREKWDAEAPADAEAVPPEATFAVVANQSVLLRGIPEFLGDLRGKRVLEYGCGLGQFTVPLAHSGASVTTFDISPRCVEHTRAKAAASGVSGSVETVVAPAEDLPFEDASFDLVFGKAILHHVDTKLGPPELRRVLKPAGRAAFAEPLGMNPVLNFVRDRVPYPHKHVRGDDQPLLAEHVQAWTSGWSAVEMHGIHLLSMVERGLGFRKPIPPLRRADEALLRRWPGLLRYCRYSTMLLTN